MHSKLSTSVKEFSIKRIIASQSEFLSDVLAIEEPLEIRIAYGEKEGRKIKNISITMRTPGNDVDLAVGFLFTENIIANYGEIETVQHIDFKCNEQKQNIIQVTLKEGYLPNLRQTDRNFYTTSSCGVCGKSSIEAIVTENPFQNNKKPTIEIALDHFYGLAKKLRLVQNNFETTGGIHASGLFSQSAELLLLREDVGRHNALDKLIGIALQQNLLPLNNHILVLSGRASFELIQKAVMAGIQFVAAIGAPSSLAVELAQENEITLIGFLKENRFNIYNQNKTCNIKEE